MEPKLTKYTDAKPVSTFPGVTRRALNWGDQAMLLQNIFAAGATVPEHAHVHEQLTFVVEGSLVVVMNGKTHTLNAGDSILLPSNVPHNAAAPDGAIVLEIFAPPREDFK